MRRGPGGSACRGSGPSALLPVRLHLRPAPSLLGAVTTEPDPGAGAPGPGAGGIPEPEPAPFVVSRPGTALAGERWGDHGPVVVVLHEGVADRRSWRPVARLLAPRATVVAYDRRGFGQTPRSREPFSHLDDLLALLDALAEAGSDQGQAADGDGTGTGTGTGSSGPVWLAGTSAGGGLALDAALSAPHRVAGLLLLAPGVSGAPEAELDPHTARFDRLLDEATATGDLAEVNRLETWLWLDGPVQPEGRVGGPLRALALEMNGIALANEDPENAGASGVDAWSRLGEVACPTIVAYGDLDVPFLVDRCHQLAQLIPGAELRRIEGAAHLSELERPDAVAELVVDLIGRPPRSSRSAEPV